MPKARPRLKVYEAQLGFYDTVVAAPNQKAALKAWGSRLNLFSLGLAKVSADEATAAAAQEYPEIPLVRPIGTTDPFRVKATGLPKMPKGLKTVDKAPPPATPEPVPKKHVDRSKLASAERALRSLDDRRKREEAELRRKEEALEQQRSSAQQAYIDARKAATAKVVAARQAYREAGGDD